MQGGGGAGGVSVQVVWSCGSSPAQVAGLWFWCCCRWMPFGQLCWV